MSQPPPYGYTNPSNPDKRPLPPGWIEQYESNYKAWFYVNTQEQPPRPSWVHPLGPPPPNNPPPSQYSPPAGPPPPSNQSPQYGGYGAPAGPSYGGPSYGGPSYGGPPHESGGSYQQQQQQQQGEWGQPQGHNKGWFGGGSQNAPQPQVGYQQAPPKKSGMGVGTMAALGVGGLLGGAVLAHEFEEHNEREREEGFDQGYQDGRVDEYRDDFGGGGW